MSDPRKTIQQLSTDISSDLRAFANEYTHMLKTTTPIRTGRARDGWKNLFRPVQIGRGGTFPLARNRVPYIERLDDGWSRQAPRGIVEPALRKTRKK